MKSVFSQSAFDQIEYIVLDGKSTDKTICIIEQNIDQISFFKSEKDTGVYDAMNKGLKIASGEFILFLNAGDELASKDIIQNIINSADEELDLIYGETNIIDQTRSILGTRTELTSRKLPQHLQKNDFLNGQVVSHQSFIARRNISPEYNLNYRCSADTDWMIQIISKARQSININQPISNYLVGGISDRQLGQCWKERFFILLKYFSPFSVLIAHIGFAFRFIKIGRYKDH